MSPITDFVLNYSGNINKVLKG